MNKFRLLIGLLLLSITLTQCSACKEPQEPDENLKATYIVHWVTHFGDDDLIQGQTYRDVFNRRLLLEDLRGYISEVKLIDENDSAIVLKDFGLLILRFLLRRDLQKLKRSNFRWVFPLLTIHPSILQPIPTPIHYLLQVPQVCFGLGIPVIFSINSMGNVI